MDLQQKLAVVYISQWSDQCLDQHLVVLFLTDSISIIRDNLKRLLFHCRHPSPPGSPCLDRRRTTPVSKWAQFFCFVAFLHSHIRQLLVWHLFCFVLMICLQLYRGTYRVAAIVNILKDKVSSLFTVFPIAERILNTLCLVILFKWLVLRVYMLVMLNHHEKCKSASVWHFKEHHKSSSFPDLTQGKLVDERNAPRRHTRPSDLFEAKIYPQFNPSAKSSKIL